MTFRRFLRRVVLPLGIFWLIIAILFIVLPSPPRDDSYPTRVLNSGKTLSRVFLRADLLKDRRPSDIYYPFWSSYESLDFLLHDDKETGQRSLEIGSGPYNPFDQYYSGTYAKIMIPLSFQSENVEISDRIRVDTRLSQQNEVYHPFLATADTVLLSWWIHHNFYYYAPIVTRSVPADRKIEVWIDFSYLFPPTHRCPNWDWDCLPPSFNDTALLVIQLPENGEPVFEFPSSTSSPSSFYIARLVILALLAPLGFLLLGIVYTVVSLPQICFFFGQAVILGIGCVSFCALVWWLFNGRPAIPVAETVRAVSTVMAETHNQPTVIVETHSNDLESAAGPSEVLGPEVEPQVNVKPSAPGQP